MIAFDAGADGIAEIRLKAPGPPASLFGGPALGELEAAVGRALADSRVRGVVLASETGDYILRDDPAETLALADPRAAFDAAMRFHALTRRMETCGTPFAAALSGPALGAGFELALACRRRFAADAPGVRFGLPNASVGLPPGGGGTQRLARMLGMRKAIRALLAGKRLAAADALRAGLVDEIAAPDAARRAARAWLGSAPDPRQPWDIRGFAIPGGGPWSAGAGPALIAANARAHARTRGNDPAARAILSCVYEGALVGIDTGLKIEARRFAQAATAPETRNRVRTLCVFAPNSRRFAPGDSSVGGSSCGLYGIRVFGAFVREGFALLGEGVRAALIENAARSAGMPDGPLAAADEASPDLLRALRGAEAFETVAVRLRRPGRRAGKGFYDYPENGGKRLWPGLAEHFPPAAESPAAAEVERRLLWIQALEAARCLEEGAIESAADGDVGSVLGWGFPAFTGGALSLIDTVGAAAFVTECDRLAGSVAGPRFAPPALLLGMAARNARFHRRGDGAAS